MANYQFTKQKDASLRKRITVEIRNAIIQGAIRPGDKLREGDIAEQMGISRGPVREALRELEAMGLVLSQPYKEAVVADVSKEEISDLLIPIRIDLESYAIRVSVHRFDEELFLLLENCINEMQKFADYGDFTSLVEQDVLFHEIVIEFSKSRFARQIWNSIVNHMHVHFIKNIKSYPDLHIIPNDHRALFRALKTRNYNDIMSCWIEHINSDSLLFCTNETKTID